jgi:hypothetical protein
MEITEAGDPRFGRFLGGSKDDAPSTSWMDLTVPAVKREVEEVLKKLLDALNESEVGWEREVGGRCKAPLYECVWASSRPLTPDDGLEDT